MQLIWFLIVGFIAGLIARALMPGRQHMGVLATTLLGILGSFVGGFFASLIGGRSVTFLRPSGILGSIIGALVVLAIYMAIGRRRRALI